MTEWKRSRHVCRVSNIRHSGKLAFLPCVKVWALGKSGLFAVCQSVNTRQRLIFVVCQRGGTRQTDSFCHVSKYGHTTKIVPKSTKFGFFVECHMADTRQRYHFSPRMHRILPRVHFAECFKPSTRQKSSLPLTLDKATTYNQFIRFGHSHVPHSNKHHIHHR